MTDDDDDDDDRCDCLLCRQDRAFLAWADTIPMEAIYMCLDGMNLYDAIDAVREAQKRAAS